MKTIGFFVILLFFSIPLFAQSKHDKAEALAKEAIKLEDNDKFPEALEKLNEAMKLDPDNAVISYEVAYCYCGQKEYKKAIKLLEDITKKAVKDDQVFQLLGNAYDWDGNSTKAIAAYERGLKKFPNSGKLNHELGIMMYGKKDYDKAMQYWETGIKSEPTYANNYYRAAKLYAYSPEKVWSLIYGEIFINMERGSKRTTEISRLMYNVFKSTMDSITPTSMKISFSKRANYATTEGMPFEFYYESSMMAGMSFVKDTANISTINSARTSFLTMWFINGNKNFSYPLFEWQKELSGKNYFEYYNYWLFSQGNERESNDWIKQHESGYNSFISWFKANKMPVTNSDKLSRLDYAYHSMKK